MASQLTGNFEPFPKSKPYFGFSKMEIGNYEIVKFKLVNNRFKKADEPNSPDRILMAELISEVVFLPAYMAVNFEDDDARVDAVNNDGKKRYLCFAGRREKDK